MSIKISFPENTELQPRLTVVGLGGAGGNAVNNMIHSRLEGVEFWVANTDAQALKHALAANKIQLGITATKGLGAGSNPEVGKIAAEESFDQLGNAIEDSHMIFITAGMGGGTGTGAAPVIARLAKEKGILTVGVVTKPFHFEGARRMKFAELGIEELEKYVDTLIIIPNQNLFRVATEHTTFDDAFKMADMVLNAGVRGITDLITMPGIINLDFADIRTVMNEMGKAVMGTGEAEGENRAVLAAEAAISNPLSDHTSIKGAKAAIINISGSNMTLFEVDAAANRIKEEVDPDANIIFGSAYNKELGDKIRVTVVATGIETKVMSPERRPQQNSLYGNKSQEKQASQEAGPAISPLKFTQFNKSSSSVMEHQKSGDEEEPIIISNISQNFPNTSYKSTFITPQPATPSNYTMHGFNSNPWQKMQQGQGEHAKSHITDNSNQNQTLETEMSNIEKEQNVKEDMFDIPAFLRKNNR